MSADPNRRGLLALLAAAPVAAAGGGQPRHLLARLRPGFAGGPFSGAARALAPAGAAAPPPAPTIPSRLAHIAAALDQDHAAVAAGLEQAALSHTRARLALAYPPEIAAYRSFGPPLRRRLYAALLARESERLAALSEPPTPPASPEPGA